MSGDSEGAGGAGADGAAHPGRVAATGDGPKDDDLAKHVEQLVARGQQLQEEGKMDDALAAFQLAENTAAANSDSIGEARAIGNQANVHTQMGKPQAAVEAYRKALAAFHAMGDWRREVTVLSNMALSFKDLDDMSSAVKAESHAVRVLEMHESESTAVDLRDALKRLGTYKRAAAAQAEDSRSGGRAEPARTPMMEFGFENLPYEDVVSRCEHSMMMVDAVAHLLRERAAAEERYSRALKEINSSASGLVRALIGNTKDVSSDQGTLHAALDACKATASAESKSRANVVVALENMAAKLSQMRGTHRSLTSRLTSEGDKAIRGVQQASRRITKASEKLDKARFRAANPEPKGFFDRFTDTQPKAPPADDAGADGDGLRRGEPEPKFVEEARMGVQRASEQLVEARHSRTHVLCSIAQQLQVTEEERLRNIAESLRLLHRTVASATHASLSAEQSEQSRIEACDPYFDMRLFVHSRRVKAMLIAQRKEAMDTSRIRSGSSEDPLAPPSSESDGEDRSLVPVQYPQSQRLLTSSAYIRTANELEPTIIKLIDDIFVGKAVIVSDGDSEDGEAEAAVGSGDATPAAEAAAGTDDGEATGTEGVDDSSECLYDARALFAHPAGRNLFIKYLNQQRAKQQDVGDGFDALALVMSHFLDACHEHDDLSGTKMMMIMSETFFREHPADDDDAPDDVKALPVVTNSSGDSVRHQFVQRIVKDHPIWRDRNCWEEMFYRSVREAVAKLHTPGSSTGDVGESTLDGSIGTMPAPGTKEWEYMYEQIIFGNLGSYALNMRTFDLPAEQAKEIVSRLAVGNELRPEMLEMLFANAEAE